MPSGQNQITERTEAMIRAGGWCSGEEIWTHVCLFCSAGLFGIAGAYFTLWALNNSQEKNPEINRDTDARAYAFFGAQFAALGAVTGKIVAKKSWQFFQWMGNKFANNRIENDIEMQALLPNLQKQFYDLGINERDEKVPRQFICPITNRFFENPVIASDGKTYNRKDIEIWLRDHNTSPVTREPLDNKTLIPNESIRTLMLDFLEKRQTDSAEHQLRN